MVQKVKNIVISLMVLLLSFSCQYLEGPAGADGQPKVNNVVFNLRINGDSGPSVYHNISSNSTAYLTWDAVTETGIKSFDIDYSGDGISDTNTTSYLFAGAVPAVFANGGTYPIQVRSIDKNGGIGEWSSVLTLIVDQTAPGAPGVTSFLDTGINQGTLIFSAPAAIDLNHFVVNIKNTTDNKSASLSISANGATIYSYNQGGTISAQNLSSAFNLVFDIASGDSGDSFEATVTAYDHAGNSASITSGVITIN